MDPLTLTLGVTLVLAGWMTGRHGRLKAKPKIPEARCMCLHGYGSHHPKTGRCHVTVIISPADRKDVLKPCACMRYVGPDPALCGLWVGPTGEDDG